MEVSYSSGDPRCVDVNKQNSARDPGARGVRSMSFAQFRANQKRANMRRRLYARINELPDSSVREELIAVVQRHELQDSHH